MRDYIESFLPLFVAINVPGILPMYLGLTETMTTAECRRLTFLAVATATIIAVLILFAGQLVFSLLGITVNDLRVGGGLILLVLSISNLIFGDYRRRDPRQGEEETEKADAEFAAAASRNDYVLAAFDGVGAGRRVTAGVEFVLPQEFAGRLIERMKFFVLRSSDEHQAAGCDNRAAKIFGPGLWNAARGQFGKFAQRYLPKNFAFVEVDRIELTPRRFDRGIAVFIGEFEIAAGPVRFHCALVGDHSEDVGLFVGIEVENAGRWIE